MKIGNGVFKMVESDLKNVDASNVIKYEKPCIITLSGLPGSGKSVIARSLSKELKIFLLSNDYIKNFYQLDGNCSDEKIVNIEKKIDLINKERLLKLLLKHASFVFDKNFNQISDFCFLNNIAKILNYNIIKIKVNSYNDDENILRINKCVMDYRKKVYGVIGDDVMYSGSYDQALYYQLRKPQMLDDSFFDYIIDNNSSEEEFSKKVNDVVHDIKVMKLTLK